MEFRRTLNCTRWCIAFQSHTRACTLRAVGTVLPALVVAPWVRKAMKNDLPPKELK